MARFSDPEAAAGEVLRLGTIASIDHANATCTVESGDILTGELPWVAQRAGGARTWSPPSEGEQCLLLAPEGDLAAALVIVGLYSDAYPPPSNDPNLGVIEYLDGATVAYDHVAHHLAVTLPAGGTVAIDAPGGVTIKGPLTVEGLITTSEDVVADSISLKGHKHDKVQAGAAQTGEPV